MKLTIQKSINVHEILFVGEVAIADEEKANVYAQLLNGATSESALKADLMDRMSLSNNDTEQLCGTLRRLGVIESDGQISNSIYMKEYGKYRLFFAENTNTESPFIFLPLRIEREKPGYSQGESRPLSEELNECLKNPRIKPSKPYGKFISTDSPIILSKSKETVAHIVYEFDSSAIWSMTIDGVHFEFDESSHPKLSSLFRYTWQDGDTGLGNLAIDFDAIKDSQRSLSTFTHSYEDLLVTNDWGEINVKYDRIPVVPRAEEAFKWYEALFLSRIASINQYRTKNDLANDWYAIQGEHKVFSDSRYDQADFRFDHSKTLRQFSPDKPQFWLMQAAEDLNPYATQSNANAYAAEQMDVSFKPIHLPIKNMADVKTDILDRWQDLRDANNIMIIDKYLNTYWHFLKLERVLNSKPSKASRIKVISTRPNDDYNPQIDRRIRVQDSLGIQFSEQHSQWFPHDRFWFLDGKVFKLTQSLDFIYLRRDRFDLQDQVTIVPMNLSDVPTHVVKEWESFNA